MDKNQITVLKRIIKNVDGRPALKGIFYDNTGRACVCDGFTAIRFNLTGALDLPVVQGIDLQPIYNQNIPDAHLIAPSKDELKTIIKESRARGEKMPLYKFNNGTYVNARYLLNILTILPDAQIFTSFKNPLTSFIYFIDGLNDAILCPVRYNH